MSMNNYTKQKKIGEGAFGKAWLVVSKSDKIQYVVKEVNTARMPQRERDDAKKEVSVLAQMKHANIVKYRESFEENGNLHIVMEYCEGGDLYIRINAQRGILFQEDPILDWFVQIALALKHMHDRKILHRDIKCQNIFLTKDGRIKLGDFGIVKVLNSTTELARTCVGTPYYLSPEICENKPYNNKSDIWSLGCVLYELTTLKHAFEAGNVKNLVLKIIRGIYPPVPPKYSYDLRNLIAQLFKRNAAERPNINAVLRKAFLQRRVERFMGNDHVKIDPAVHGIRINQVAGASPVAVGRAKPIVGTPIRIPGNNNNNVVSPLAAPLKRVKPSQSPSPSPAAIKRREVAKPMSPLPAGPSPSPFKINKEEIDKKDYLIQRKNEMDRRLRQKREQILLMKQQKELSDKQKQVVINEAREAGWRNILQNNEDHRDAPPAGAAMREAAVDESIASAASPPNPVGAGRYAHFYAKLEQHKQSQEREPMEVAKQIGGPGVYYQFNRAKYMENPNKAVLAAQKGADSAAQGEQAAERARLVEDYLQARYIAARNKARENNGVAALLGGGRPTAAASERNRQEEEYLARLEAIRRQNFHHRQFDALDRPRDKDGFQLEDMENRRLMIERLKRQSEEKRKLLQEHLDLKRRMEQNQRQGINSPVEVKRQSDEPALFPIKKPTPVAIKPPSMTAMMEALDGGANFKPSPTPSSGQPIHNREISREDEIDASDSQSSRVSSSASLEKVKQKKEGILKRLNAKAVEDRHRWNVPDSVDSQGDVRNSSFLQALAGRQLEETASQMERTHAIAHKDPPVLPKRAWGGQTGAKLPEIWSNAEIDTCTEEEDKSAKDSLTATFELSTPTLLHDQIKSSGSSSSSSKIIPTQDEGETKVRDGLSTGRFDLPFAALLRTCSLPDLSPPKPVKTTLEKSSGSQENEDFNDYIAVLTETSSKSYSDNGDHPVNDTLRPNDENSEDFEEDNDDVEEEEVEGSDEDLENIRESMKELLESSADRDVVMAHDDDDNDDDDASLTHVHSKPDNEDDTVTQHSFSPTNWEEHETEDTGNPEEWDDNEDFGDYDNGDVAHLKADIFSSLEKDREFLESELGLDLLLKAYNAIQALQEDEDESATEGEQAVRKLLGDKAHYYEKILQLVLKDGAFMD